MVLPPEDEPQEEIFAEKFAEDALSKNEIEQAFNTVWIR
jgi:hypothetical protein